MDDLLVFEGGGVVGGGRGRGGLSDRCVTSGKLLTTVCEYCCIYQGSHRSWCPSAVTLLYSTKPQQAQQVALSVQPTHSTTWLLADTAV